MQIFNQDTGVEVDGRQMQVRPIAEVTTVGCPTFWMGVEMNENGSPTGAFVAVIEGKRAWITQHECPSDVIEKLPKDDFEHLHDAKSSVMISFLEKDLVKASRRAQRDAHHARSKGEGFKEALATHRMYDDCLFIVRVARAKKESLDKHNRRLAADRVG